MWHVTPRAVWLLYSQPGLHFSNISFNWLEGCFFNCTDLELYYHYFLFNFFIMHQWIIKTKVMCVAILFYLFIYFILLPFKDYWWWLIVPPQNVYDIWLELHYYIGAYPSIRIFLVCIIMSWWINRLNALIH